MCNRPETKKKQECAGRGHRNSEALCERTGCTPQKEPLTRMETPEGSVTVKFSVIGSEIGSKKWNRKF